MEPFEQIWETSRHNSWSWGYPTSLLLGVIVLSVLALVRKTALRRLLAVVAILAFTLVAAELSAREIREKWRLRREWADSHKDQMTDAAWSALTVDGANLTLGPLLYGAQAAVLFVAAALMLAGIRRSAFPVASTRARSAASERDDSKPVPVASSP